MAPDFWCLATYRHVVVYMLTLNPSPRKSSSTINPWGITR